MVLFGIEVWEKDVELGVEVVIDVEMVELEVEALDSRRSPILRDPACHQECSIRGPYAQ